MATPPSPPPPASSAPPLGGTARRPVAVVMLDGVELPLPISVKTVNVAHNAADTFEVEFPLGILPADANWAAWGGTAPPSEIEILYGLLDQATGKRGPLTSAVRGPVDTVEVDQPEGIIRLRGRDYSSALIDTQTFQNFTNQTASQIATKIAQNHGLTPQVTATTTPVGSKDEGTGDTTRVTRRESEWDLLTTLARNEGFVVFVRGKTLYFQPDTDPTGPHYSLVWVPPATPGAPPQGNFTKLHLKRALTLARDIVVTVTSHSATHGKAVTQTAKKSAGGAGGGKGAGKPQAYVVDIPGLTDAQALARAQQLLKSYSLFERVIEVHMPGDDVLNFEQPLSLSGTGTGWDSVYFSDRIERSLSMHGGFSMVIRAKNHSTSQTATTIPGASS